MHALVDGCTDEWMNEKLNQKVGAMFCKRLSEALMEEVDMV
jgi:hypothetical protein